MEQKIRNTEQNRQTLFAIVRNLLSGTVITVCVTVITISAQSSGRPDGMRFVPDVIGQIKALTNRADPLGLHIGTTPNPSSCRHYQGLVRVNRADGRPFFLLTRSGNTPPLPGPDEPLCVDSPGETRNGHLIVFRLGSRDKNGERLRSNRLMRGGHVDSTAPSPLDRGTIHFTFVGGDPNDPDPTKRPGLVAGDGPNDLPPRVYQHPGGMQTVGNVMVVALEKPRQFGKPEDQVACVFADDAAACERYFGYERAPNKSVVQFYDVSDPENPVFKSQFALVDGNSQEYEDAGIVAITPLPDGRYLMAVSGGANNPTVYFYRSAATDLMVSDPGWAHVDTWYANTDQHIPISDFNVCELAGAIVGPGNFCLSPDEQYLEQNWPDGKDGFTHQTIQFLREGGIEGTLYLAGIRGKFGSDTSTADAYRVDCVTPACNTGEIRLKRAITRDFTPFPNTGGSKLASFAAASDIYISPSGELILYVTEHDNDGPSETVKAGEWRHRDVVRPGSPTLMPTAMVNGPYTVDEGSSVIMSGSADPPITRPFIQLFHGTDLLGFNPIADYDDRFKDDFDNLFGLELQVSVTPGNPPSISIFHHADKARSLNWLAPPGCTIRASDFGGSTSGDEPETLTLTGSGTPQSIADLTQVFSDGTDSDINQEIDAIEFLGDCDSYYDTPFQLRWDRDVNGSFETTGSSATFNASAVDGPSIVNVPVQALHPSGGQTGQAAALVTVRNVAPAISSLALTDPAGNAVNSTVPFVLTGMPINAGATFTDPGVLDHQTAVMNWGDGTVESQGSFVSFNEAFGDGTGAAADTHTYSTGGTYTLSLSVTDDDGGSDTESATLRVLTPEQAVMELIDLLDAVIAGTPPGKVRKDLEKARKALAGNPNGNNGALDKIRNGNIQAAIAHIDQAIRALQDAQAGGANVAVLIALLEQVKTSLLAT